MRNIVSAVALTAFAAAASADPNTGGFKGPDATQLMTVAEAKEQSEDRAVKVQGYIVKSIGDEKYELQDDSGILVVEIDDEDWRGLEVTPSDRVELSGEIDKERNEVELEAESIRLAQ